MKKVLPVILVLLMATGACNSNNNKQSIKALSKSLVLANMSITENNQMLLSSLEEKAKDPQTRALASIWAPKALAIKNKAVITFQYVEEVKNQVRSLKEGDVSGAGNNPAHQALLNKDRGIFKKAIGLRFKTIKDSTSDEQVVASDWMKCNLANVTPALAMAMLDKLQNDVLVTENTLLEYCNNHSVSSIQHYETFKPLISMNRSYVKSGQTIEVTAGVVLCRNLAIPHITIDGKPVKADEDGVAVWKFNAKTKPGKYKVVVAIEHLWPDGRPC